MLWMYVLKDISNSDNPENGSNSKTNEYVNKLNK